MSTPEFWNGALFGAIATILISGLIALAVAERARRISAANDEPDWGAGQ